MSWPAEQYFRQANRIRELKRKINEMAIKLSDMRERAEAAEKKIDQLLKKVVKDTDTRNRYKK